MVPQVIEAIYEAVNAGFRLPIVYNTSSYDSMKSLELLEGLIDIYMPDFKFWSESTSERLCKARNYSEVTRKVIKEMHRQVGPLTFNPNGIAQKGLLVRHLVMPNQTEEGKEIMAWLASKFFLKDLINRKFRDEFT